VGEGNCNHGHKNKRNPPPSLRKQASTSNMKNMSINIKTTAISTTASDTAK
jgi:hypothetical protein